MSELRLLCFGFCSISAELFASLRCHKHFASTLRARSAQPRLRPAEHLSVFAFSLPCRSPHFVSAHFGHSLFRASLYAKSVGFSCSHNPCNLAFINLSVSFARSGCCSLGLARHSLDSPLRKNLFFKFLSLKPVVPAASLVGTAAFANRISSVRKICRFLLLLCPVVRHTLCPLTSGIHFFELRSTQKPQKKPFFFKKGMSTKNKQSEELRIYSLIINYFPFPCIALNNYIYLLYFCLKKFMSYLYCYFK